MKRQDFNYELPEELIAQKPLSDRTASRLLVLERGTGNISHRHFTDILEYLKKEDCIVINDTKVIPARLLGVTKDTGATLELLLLKRLDKYTWEALSYPGKKTRPGRELIFGKGKLECKVLSISKGGNRIVKFKYDGLFENILEEIGEIPLPPYIHESLEDKNRYQTVYAKYEGSAAAPTAGLHFTPELLSEIEKKGVKIAKITLHVGLSTFRPVKEEDIKAHEMHTESYFVSKEAAEIINETKKAKGSIFCVGTTSIRALESCADENGRVREQSGLTDIFIYPGYKFKVTEKLITNFHLPESTLIMLVSALAGRENVITAYKEAVDLKYRFFSFGDAMLII